ncbi:MAG: hypothetical protein JW864_04290 [Spirochaetes bacterium]|nr:hypothetical protein [Spirochaetota bacterium]
MPQLTAEQILKEIDSLPPQEKDNLYLLLDQKEQDELSKRMSISRSDDLDENELFNH